MIQHQEKSRIWILIPVIMILLLGMGSCSDSTSVTDRQPLSAVMQIGGKLIKTTYSEWPIPENEVPAVDTTRVGFFIHIHSLKGETSEIRLYGLEGADVGKHGNQLFPNCSHPDECKVTGTLTDEKLNIDIQNDGRSYKAEGFIYQTYDPYLVMTATYRYENITFEYELEGRVFDE